MITIEELTAIGPSIIAIDVEGFLHGFPFFHLVQLSIGDEDTTVVLSADEALQNKCLKGILESNVIKVMHGAKDDIKALEAAFKIKLKNVEDTQRRHKLLMQPLSCATGLLACVQHDMYRNVIVEVSKEMQSLKLEVKQTMSKFGGSIFAKGRVTKRLLQYAANDAIMTFRLYSAQSYLLCEGTCEAEEEKEVESHDLYQDWVKVKSASPYKPAWVKSHDTRVTTNSCELYSLIDLLPTEMRYDLQSVRDEKLNYLQQLIVQVDKPLVAVFNCHVKRDSHTAKKKRLQLRPTSRDSFNELQSLISTSSNCNCTFSGLMHRVTVVGDIISIRIHRSVFGIANVCSDLIDKNILIVGAPGSGKTTFLRDMARLIADTREKTLVAADPNKELSCAGSAALYLNMANKDALLQASSIGAHSICVDSIEADDVKYLSNAIHSGVSIVATVNGSSFENAINGIAAPLLGNAQMHSYDDKIQQCRTMQCVFDVVIILKEPSASAIQIYGAFRPLETEIDAMLSKKGLLQTEKRTQDANAVFVSFD